MKTRHTQLAVVTVGLTLLATGVILAPGGHAIGLRTAATSPTPTPSCREWQTVTQIPSAPPTSAISARSSSSTTAPPLPSRAVCRNAPPTPFSAPVWAPESVVGGPRLAETGVVIDAGSDVPAPPEVEDVSYVLADMDTGEILAAKSAHAWLRPASTLKTLTALTLLPRLDPKRIIITTPEMQSAEGTRAGMLAGNPYPVSSLFDALLMLSANDAAYGLAEAAGGYQQTAALMNAKAAEIGAHDTLALDPSGLDEGNQRSSAYDLALIGRAAMARPDFRTYVTKRDALFPGGKAADTGTLYPPFHLYNINELLSHYPGAIGVKPGRTNRAQHTFIGAATRGGRTLIVAQMGSTTGSWKPTAALLDWGFSNADKVRAVGRLVEPGAPAPREAPPTSLPTDLPTTLPGQTTHPTGRGNPPSGHTVAAGPGLPGAGPLDDGTATWMVAGGIGLLTLGALVSGALFLRRGSRGRHRPGRAA